MQTIKETHIVSPIQKSRCQKTWPIEKAELAEQKLRLKFLKWLLDGLNEETGLTKAG